MPSSLEVALFPALGVAVGAIIGLFGVVVNNIVLLKKEREQRQYELTNNREQREHERAIENEKWRREQAQLAFTNTLFNLTNVYNRANLNEAKMSEEALARYTETQKWFGLALSYWPKDSPTYSDIKGEIISMYLPYIHPFTALRAREHLLRMMAEDPELDAIKPGNYGKGK